MKSNSLPNAPAPYETDGPQPVIDITQTFKPLGNDPGRTPPPPAVPAEQRGDNKPRSY